MRCGFQLPAFTAIVIGIKGKSSLIDSPKQNNTTTGFTISGYRSQGHGIVVGQLGFQCIIEPGFKLDNGILGYISFT